MHGEKMFLIIFLHSNIGLIKSVVVTCIQNIAGNDLYIIYDGIAEPVKLCQ